MSRIGKKPVPVPASVTVNVAGQNVSVKGPKGELKAVLAEQVIAKLENGGIDVQPRDETKFARSCWGMSRTLVANMIKGVTQGYSRNLEINGVGFRAAVQGKQLQLQLGFSHDVNYPIPPGITIATPKPTEIVVSGVDKQQFGQPKSALIARPNPTRAKA
jgi:large subunit ribosomal protein L6